MKLILKFVENNYMEKITIEDVAKEVNLSQSHFMKYFKNTMGTSFIDYLNEYRLTMASRLLISSDLTGRSKNASSRPRGNTGSVMHSRN